MKTTTARAKGNASRLANNDPRIVRMLRALAEATTATIEVATAAPEDRRIVIVARTLATIEELLFPHPIFGTEVDSREFRKLEGWAAKHRSPSSGAHAIPLGTRLFHVDSLQGWATFAREQLEAHVVSGGSRIQAAWLLTRALSGLMPEDARYWPDADGLLPDGSRQPRRRRRARWVAKIYAAMPLHDDGRVVDLMKAHKREAFAADSIEPSIKAALRVLGVPAHLARKAFSADEEKERRAQDDA